MRCRSSFQRLASTAAWLCGALAPTAFAVTATWQRIPGLHSAAQALALVHESDGRCQLPSAAEFLDWSRRTAEETLSLDEGLYWVRSVSDREVGYGLYVHWPTRQVVEYGNLMFDAHVVLVCTQAAAISVHGGTEPR